MIPRRTLLSFLGTLSLGVYGLPSRASAARSAATSRWLLSQRPVGCTAGDEALEGAMDEALEMLAPYAASFRGGLSNHGPMAAEALVALGHQDAVIDWVDSYRKRLEDRPAAHERIEADDWHDALGDRSRVRDWDEWFTNELAEAPWRDVVGLWVPRLAPGIAAAGLHCVIRVGHAVCSLEVNETPQRLDELARALAYWAADFLLLPGEPTDAGDLAPSAALKEVELLPRELRASRGLITTEMKDLVGFEPFVGVINLVDPAAGSPDFMADLLATFAGTFINTTSNSFEFLHAVTGSAAMVELLRYVKTEQRAAVQAYTWQVTAGIFARYGQPSLVADFEVGSSEESTERLAKLAVASGDEHTIKLVCACTRAWRQNPDPRFLAAAARRVK